MADRVYQLACGKFVKGQIDLEGGANKLAVLFDSGYTPDTSLTGHEFLSDIPGGARLATTTLTACTVSVDGIFDADDATFTGVTGTITGIAIYKNTGTEASSPLLFLIESLSGTLTYSAATVTATWDPAGICKLG